MDIDARIAVLKQAPLYHGLDEREFAAVAKDARNLSLATGDELFRQGEDAAHGYVLGWGRLRLVQQSADGQNVTLRYMNPGDMVGTVAVLRRIPFPATAIAVEDCVAFSWSAVRIADHLQRFPLIAQNAIGVVGGRVEELMARLQETATQRVERRIAGALVRLAKQSGRRVEDGVEIPFPISRQDLAEMTATTLHTVSRTLSAWNAEGVVEARRTRCIVVRDLQRLTGIAEEP